MSSCVSSFRETLSGDTAGGDLDSGRPPWSEGLEPGRAPGGDQEHPGDDRGWRDCGDSVGPALGVKMPPRTCPN